MSKGPSNGICLPRPFTLLLVEDDPTWRLLLEEILAETWPCRVLSAATGQKALQIASHIQCNLLLLDYQLKGAITGLDVYDQICTHHPLPAIVMSACPPDIGTRPLSVVRKPVDLDDLLTSIQRLLQTNGIAVSERVSLHNAEKREEQGQIWL